MMRTHLVTREYAFLDANLEVTICCNRDYYYAIALKPNTQTTPNMHIKDSKSISHPRSLTLCNAVTRVIFSKTTSPGPEPNHHLPTRSSRS
jgi:hypothetical protein